MAIPQPLVKFLTMFQWTQQPKGTDAYDSMEKAATKPKWGVARYPSVSTDLEDQ